MSNIYKSLRQKRIIENSIIKDRIVPKKEFTDDPPKYYYVTGDQTVHLYRGRLGSCKDASEERSSLQLQNFLRASAEESAAILKAQVEGNSESRIRGMTRLDERDLSRMIRKYREQTYPAPQIQKYYYLPDGAVAFVYDDGFELRIKDKRESKDTGLKSEGYFPIDATEAIGFIKILCKNKVTPDMRSIIDRIASGRHPIDIDEPENMDASHSRQSRGKSRRDHSRLAPVKKG